MSNLFQSYLQLFVGLNFQSCCLLKFSKSTGWFATFLGFLVLGWKLTSWLNFFFHYRAQPDSGSELPFAIMSTLILDSLENIRDKKASLRLFWTKSPFKFGAYCIQGFKTPISVVWGIQGSKFGTEMGDKNHKMIKQLRLAAVCQWDPSRHHYCRPGPAGSPVWSEIKKRL